METAGACAGACGTRRKLLRADTKNLLVLLRHCADEDSGSHSPSVGWDGRVMSKHRLDKLEVHSGGGGGFSSKGSSQGSDG